MYVISYVNILYLQVVYIVIIYVAILQKTKNRSCIMNDQSLIEATSFIAEEMTSVLVAIAAISYILLI